MKYFAVIRCLFYAAMVCSALLFTPVCLAQSMVSAAVDVRMVTDEAEAVLAILAKKEANQLVTDADWQRLFASEGYVRLKKRESQMGRSFQDEAFKAFVLSDKLIARASALKETLDNWRRADVSGAARRALDYLPEGPPIRAKIYPVIKPQENSFVFEVKTDPAIFLYVDPGKSKAQFENTLAHELHHIGYASRCLPKRTSEASSKRPPNVQTVIDWIGSFGEGIAMLAAAGGPDVHPHAVSNPADRARWDRDVANFREDLQRVEKFFLDVLENRLSKKEEIEKVAFSFFGIQGPWYTVGWQMAVTIEKTYGRARLIDCLCDPPKLLSTYNQAATEYNRSAHDPLALWSSSLIEGISKADRLR
jgi:hypothetical protein